MGELGKLEDEMSHFLRMECRVGLNFRYDVADLHRGPWLRVGTLDAIFLDKAGGNATVAEVVETRDGRVGVVEGIQADAASQFLL